MPQQGKRGPGSGGVRAGRSFLPSPASIHRTDEGGGRSCPEFGCACWRTVAVLHSGLHPDSRDDSPRTTPHPATPPFMWFPTTPRTSAVSPLPAEGWRVDRAGVGGGVREGNNRQVAHPCSAQASCPVWVLSGKPQPLSLERLPWAPQPPLHTAVLSTGYVPKSHTRPTRASPGPSLGRGGQRGTRDDHNCEGNMNAR